MITVGLIGCGAWATTVAKLLGDNGHSVLQWCHRKEYIQAINNKHENSIALPGIKLSETVKAVSNIEQVIQDVDCIVLGLASNYIPHLIQYKSLFKSNIPILNLAKGVMEDQQSFLISDFLKKNLNITQCAMLSGPNLAGEISMGLPAASVVAANSSKIAQQFQLLLSQPTFRVYTSTDLIGVEICGVLKNIIAIAAGVSDGYGLGHNSKASLVSRGLDEISAFGLNLGASNDTFFGLAGLGDLMLTTNSNNSRNWQAGAKYAKNFPSTRFNRLGNGFDHSVSEQKTIIAEGLRSAKTVYQQSVDRNINMPIC